MPRRSLDSHARSTPAFYSQAARDYVCTWGGDRSSGTVADSMIVADFNGAPVDDELRRAPGMPEALKDATAWSKLKAGATVELSFDNGETAVGKVTRNAEKQDTWMVTLEENGNTWPLDPATHTFRALDGDSDSSEEEGGGDSYMWTEDEDRRLTSLMVEKQAHVSWATVCECLANDRSARQVQHRWDAIAGEFNPDAQDRRVAREQMAALVSKRTRSLLSPPATPFDGPGGASALYGSEGPKRGRKADKSKPAPKLFVKETGKETYQDWSDEHKSSRNIRQTRLMKEFRTLLEKAQEKEAAESSPRGAPSPTGSDDDGDDDDEDDDDDDDSSKKIDYDDGPGRTLIEQTFRDGLELAESRAGSDFAQFGPWVGRRVILERDDEEPVAEGGDDSADKAAHGPGAVIGWSAGEKTTEAQWKIKTDGNGVADLAQSELAEAMAAAEKSGIISFGVSEGMQKTEDLDDVCDELDELLECALDRIGGNQIVWAKSPAAPWWPAEFVSPQETRAVCLLAPRLIEDWETDQVLVRYFGSNERVGWVLANKALGFDEVNNVACMPSKSSKFRLAVLESMEQAGKRAAELNQITAIQEPASGRASRGSQAAADEDGGRRRRQKVVPARFREVAKSPAKKPKSEKPVKHQPRSAAASAPKAAARSARMEPSAAMQQQAAAIHQQQLQEQQASDRNGGPTRLSPLEAHIARQTLVQVITDVWVEYSVEEKQEIVARVNNALYEANQQSIYTVPKLNKYIQNLRYKAQTTGGVVNPVKRPAPTGQMQPVAKRRMPTGLSSGNSPRDGLPAAAAQYDPTTTDLTAFLAAAAGGHQSGMVAGPQWLQCTFAQAGPLNMEFDETMLVIRVDQGGQAWQQGVRVGMRLVQFQDVNLTELSFEAIMTHIRRTPRPWALAFGPVEPENAAPQQWSPTKRESPGNARPSLVELCESFYKIFGTRTGPIHPKEAIEALKVRPRHMYDLLSLLESAGAVAALPAVSGGRKAVVHAGHRGMSNVLAHLCAAKEPVSPLSERDGRTWRFLSTGLQHAASAILHILLRNGGGPLLSSTVTFFMWEMISEDRKEDTNNARDGPSAVVIEAGAGLTFDVLGIGYFTRTFTESSISPLGLLAMLDDPNQGRPGVVAFLNAAQPLNLSIPDSEWVCDQINERRPTLVLVEQAARAATATQTAQVAAAEAAGAAPAADTSPESAQGGTLTAGGQGKAANNDHKTAVELDRLHKQLREVFDLLSCEQLSMCIHRALPSGQNIHLACSDPAIIEAGRRLNTRCGFNETILQLNTQAFPITTPPAAGVQQVGGSAAAAAVAAAGTAGATSASLHKSASGDATPKVLPDQVGDMVYYAGQIVQCPRCSLRFRSPQSCHSLVCPDCVLPIEDENVSACECTSNHHLNLMSRGASGRLRVLSVMRANAQLMPPGREALNVKAEQTEAPAQQPMQIEGAEKQPQLDAAQQQQLEQQQQQLRQLEQQQLALEQQQQQEQRQPQQPQQPSQAQEQQPQQAEEQQQ